ncbi:MAG TPA: hypothetical protein VNM22_00245 [Candidatus Limnocylindrales bacterium]|nr:hypothetical protein [Candidatus Limnocylindrales bacterium]
MEVRTTRDMWNRQSTQRLLWLAVLITVLGVFHHLDHIVRGNHIGWPITSRVTSFTLSLLIYAWLLPGLYFTTRGKVGSGYWVGTAIPLLLLVVFVHFNPSPKGESWRDIYLPYANPAAYCGKQLSINPPVEGASWLCNSQPAPSRPWLGVLAVANTLGLVVAVAGLLVTAVFS